MDPATPAGMDVGGRSIAQNIKVSNLILGLHTKIGFNGLGSSLPLSM
jgi:hypothetical protein